MSQQGDALDSPSLPAAARGSALTLAAVAAADGAGASDPPRATGVLVEVGYQKGRAVQPTLQFIPAGKGVLLAAGALKTPQLLMLSGVGDQGALRGHGIDPVSHSPLVGANFIDRPIMSFGLLSTRDIPKHLGYAAAVNSTAQVLVEMVAGTGVAAGAAITQLALVPPGLRFNALREPLKLAFSVEPFKTLLDRAQQQPQSRGSVQLRSASATDAPKVKAGYFNDADGVDIAKQAEPYHIRKPVLPGPLAGLVNTMAGPLADLLSCLAHDGDHLPYTVVPCPPAELTTEGWKEWARANVLTSYHYFGTARIGRRNDAASRSGVTLSVHGVAGLHVIDTAAFPFAARNNPQLAAAAAGIG
eukprot:gene29680-32978_t